MEDEQELRLNFEKIASQDERRRVVEFAEALAGQGAISDVFDWERLQRALHAIEPDYGRKAVFDFARVTAVKSQH